MKVNFETDYRDFADAMWIAYKSNPVYKNNFLNFIILYATVAAVSSLVVLMYAPSFVFALFNFGIVFALCFYLFRPPNRAYFVNQYLQIYGGKPFDYEIELDEENVKIGDGLSKSIVSWRRIREIIETEDSLLLIFKYQSGLKIPKKAFHEPLKIGEFVAFATSRIPASDEALNVRSNK